MNQLEMIAAIAAMGRHDRIPSRDLFMALDQIESYADTIDKIKAELDRLDTLPMFQRQAN